MNLDDTPKCFAAHMGAWLHEPATLSQLVDLARADLLPMAIADGGDAPQLKVTGGLAIIHIDGVMMKGRSKFGGTASTVEIRRMIRDANARDDVKEILLEIESGGGAVSGTYELAQEVKNSGKRVTAHISDIGASAAYWVAAQAAEISCNVMAEVGSIGVYAVLADTSGAYEREGVKVHVVSTGGVKGALADGAEISDEALSEVQTAIDRVGEKFIQAISHRGGEEWARSMADGRVYDAEQAKELGLIDRIETLDEAISRALGRIEGASRASKIAIRQKQIRIK